MEANSRRRHKPMLLLDSEVEEHAIEFEEGKATAVICPKLGRCPITRVVAAATASRNAGEARASGG